MVTVTAALPLLMPEGPTASNLRRVTHEALLWLADPEPDPELEPELCSEAEADAYAEPDENVALEADAESAEEESVA